MIKFLNQKKKGKVEMKAVELTEKFGSMVFNDKVMKERLGADAYSQVRRSIDEGTPLSRECAKEVAAKMKEWAIEKGATHYTHWFQPMTGVTAEKHNSFIEPSKSGEPIMKFSENSLLAGESDASSFPNGGLRATFEARGYAAWDITSYAFIKDGSLYIPTAFCSYGGEALDKKTPLLRSMYAIDKQAKRILALFGKTDVKKVVPTVGAEQEYFLISKEVYEKRIDLIHCGRTLFGARPSKGQELEDHYYGSIKSQVAAFMKDVDEELWELGVYSKTKHNEVAPAQHELAAMFMQANVACDQNQLTMEVIKSVANKHGMVCLLNEKPFAKVSGSGKHDNWSLSTDTGENLLEPGETPRDNAQFLLFLLAVVKAVDEYQDLLRISVASAGNDHRLGANEAPPAIVSVFLGDELDGILKAIENGESYSAKEKGELKIGISTLPPIPKDTTDRNRTSPFAFTGNKFEFRMVGSAENISCPNFIINTIVAEELSGFADYLEGAKDFNVALNDLLVKTIKEHKRIIFNGNNYSKVWKDEAEKRGLLNYISTVDAVPHYNDPKNVKTFEKHGVLSESEIISRQEIKLENYANVIHIEGLTAVDMARKEIAPAVIEYEKFLLSELDAKKEFDFSLDTSLERDSLKKISTLSGKFIKTLNRLERELKKISTLSGKFIKTLNRLEREVEKFSEKSGAFEQAKYCREVILADMEKLRYYADAMELIIGKKFCPFPTYEDILYSIKY